MPSPASRHPRTLSAAALMLLAFVITSPSAGQDTTPGPDIGVDRAALSPVVSNPHVALSTLKRAVYTGKERDADTGKASRIRIEITVRDTAETVAGVKVTVVDVTQFADDEAVEKARDFYAQHSSGAVHYLGSLVDDYDGGKVIGHDGQWVAGEGSSKAGLLMPAAPKVGDPFEQQRAPGIAQSRSKVLSTARTVKVPAGTFKDCVEVECYDPIEKATQRKWYCPGVGLVRESSVERTVELTERVAR